ncbi:MAG TPA: hypothetical protein PKN47_01810 [Nitrospira sp.]|nr:hypothetical protein [Nitrospira sp.]
MSKSKNSQTPPRPQGSWMAPPIPGATSDEGRLAGIMHGIRAAMVASIKRSPLSRFQLAGVMGELLDRDVSKDMLDKYTSESAEAHRPPADTLAAFCLATNSIDALDVLAESVGCVLTPICVGMSEDLSTELRSGVIRIAQEFGEAAGAVEDAASDGEITPKEAARIRRELRDVIQRAVAVSALLAQQERLR